MFSVFKIMDRTDNSFFLITKGAEQIFIILVINVHRGEHESFLFITVDENEVEVNMQIHTFVEHLLPLRRERALRRKSPS